MQAATSAFDSIMCFRCILYAKLCTCTTANILRHHCGCCVFVVDIADSVLQLTLCNSLDISKQAYNCFFQQYFGKLPLTLFSDCFQTMSVHWNCCAHSSQCP